MNQKIMNYVPKSKVAAIRDAYKDEDGYWICLNEGWKASRTDRGCHTIHEDTIKELRYQIAGIQRVTTEDPEPEKPEKVGGITAVDSEPETVYDPAEMARPEEYQAIHDSMVETFYEYCTGEPAPENWREIVREERARKKPTETAEAVEIILDDITEDPEYHDTPIPPRNKPDNPDPQLPAPTGNPGRGAAETVAFGLCLGLAYAVYGARELLELAVLALQALWVTLVPIAKRTAKELCKAWLGFYPVARETAGRTTKVAAKQMAMAVWYLWIVIV